MDNDIIPTILGSALLIAGVIITAIYIGPLVVDFMMEVLPKPR